MQHHNDVCNIQFHIPLTLSNCLILNFLKNCTFSEKEKNCQLFGCPFYLLVQNRYGSQITGPCSTNFKYYKFYYDVNVTQTVVTKRTITTIKDLTS